MRILDIIPGTSVDGPGLRTSIYVAGCTHRCPGCHNPQSWPVEAGREMSLDQIMAVVDYNGHDVTLTGGDPLMQAAALLPLAKAVASRGLTLWCYTGYTYEQAMELPGGARELLEMCEVLVDGPYVESLRDTGLLYRGSANQRLVDLRRSRPGQVVEWTLPPLEW